MGARSSIVVCFDSVDREHGEWHIDIERGVVKQVDAWIEWGPVRPALMEREAGIALSFDEAAKGFEAPLLH